MVFGFISSLFPLLSVRSHSPNCVCERLFSSSFRTKSIFLFCTIIYMLLFNHQENWKVKKLEGPVRILPRNPWWWLCWTQDCRNWTINNNCILSLHPYHGQLEHWRQIFIPKNGKFSLYSLLSMDFMVNPLFGFLLSLEPNCLPSIVLPVRSFCLCNSMTLIKNNWLIEQMLDVSFGL